MQSHTPDFVSRTSSKKDLLGVQSEPEYQRIWTSLTTPIGRTVVDEDGKDLYYV